MYGREVILDVYDANSALFTRSHIESYFVKLCDALRLERADLHFWDYDDPEERAAAPAHLKGVSAIQFVTTSSVVIHTLDETRQVLVNVFGCGEIDASVVERITIEYFGGHVANMQSIARGYSCAL